MTRQLIQLDQGLQAFQTAARQLGSSVGLLASASQLRMRLHTVEALFHENAADLFPDIKPRVISETDQHKPKKRTRLGSRRVRRNSKAIFLRPVLETRPDPETLPGELTNLARDVKSFLNHLEEFPEFMDEALNASITAFESDLRVSPRQKDHFFFLIFHSTVQIAFPNTEISSVGPLFSDMFMHSA